MIFNKELMLNRIIELGDYNTIQYIAQSSFFVPLILTWLITLITFLLVAFVPNRPNLYIAFAVAIIINLLLTIAIILGVFPSLMTFPNLVIA